MARKTALAGATGGRPQDEGDALPFTVRFPLRHNGQRLFPGDTVSLTAAEADRLLAAGALEPREPPAESE